MGLPPLSVEEFQLLVSYLERLLSQAPDASGRREARSSDGRWRLSLEEPPLATRPIGISTTDGQRRLAMPAYSLTVESIATEPGLEEEYRRASPGGEARKVATRNGS